MCEKDQAILSTLLGVMRKYGKNYCVPSLKTILRLLQEYHKIKMSPRSLCYHMKELEAKGYIKRYRRHMRGPCGKMEFRSTAYYVLGKVANLAKKLINMAKSFVGGSRVQKIAQYCLHNNNYHSQNSEIVDNSSPPASFGRAWRAVYR